MASEELINYLKKLKGKAEVTRSTHSRMGEKYGFRALFINVVLLAGSAISSALIFTNFDKQIYVLAAGVFSLILFILSLVELLLDYDKKSADHNQAVNLLTSLIRDMDQAEETKNVDESIMKSFHDRYKWINESSPLTSDKDFLEAKRQYRIKKSISKALDDDKNLDKSIKQLEAECIANDSKKN